MELWISLTLFSAITFAVADIITKKFISKYDVSPTQIMFEQYLLTSIVVLVFFLPFIEFSFFYNYYYIFIIKALCSVTFFAVYYNMLKKYEISIVSPLTNLSPIVLLFFTTTILGEILTPLQVLGILITIAATYILEVHHNHHEKKEPHKFHFKELFKKPSTFFLQAFIILLMLSLNSIFDKMIFNLGADIYTNMYFTAVMILFFVSIYFIYKKRFFLRLKNIIEQPQTLSISVVKLLDNFVILNAIMMPTAVLSMIIPLRRTSTLFSSIIGGIIFHEKHMFKKLISVVLMLIGISFIVV